MDVDFSDYGSESDVDMQSVLSSEEDHSVALPSQVHEFCVPIVAELSDLVKKFPNIPDAQRKAWSKSSSRVANSSVPSYKFALIGKTGSGKSTLINNLLGESILPSSAAFSILIVFKGACTSAITEIAYADSDTQATVTFMSSDAWKQVVDTQLRELREDDGIAEPAASKHAQYISRIHPRILAMSKKDLGNLTASKLLQQDEMVRTKLGTSCTLNVSGAPLSIELQEYLSSSNGSRTTLWPIVEKVRISGRFPLLATGVILVDLPGHGDDDDTRNNSAVEYLRDADGVILVVDARRAQDDRDTLGHLRQQLKQLVLDGRDLANFVLLAVTGTDIPIRDNEIQLEPQDREEVSQLDKKIAALSRKASPQKAKTSSRGVSKSRTSSPKKEASKASTSTHLHRDKIQGYQQEKKLVLAKARIGNIRRAMQETFQQMYSALVPNGGEIIPELPLFCIGGHDYDALLTLSTSPVVFTSVDETGIPDMQSRLHLIGQRRRIEWAGHLLNTAAAFSEEVNLYFAQERYSGRLLPANKNKARSLIDHLVKKNTDETTATWHVVGEDLQRVETSLQDAIAKAIQGAPRVLKDFNARLGNNHSAYKALMRNNGIHNKHGDLNKLLTDSIMPHIQTIWNEVMNRNIPSMLKKVTQKLEKNTIDGVGEITKVLHGSGSPNKSITAATRSLSIEVTLSDMRVHAGKIMVNAQRQGNRAFSTILQQELTSQYQSASKLTGNGAVKRMKDSIADSLTQQAFDPISVSIRDLLQSAFSHVKEHYRQELLDIVTLLHVSLIEEVDLSKEDKVAKAQIIDKTGEYRPPFAAKKCDINDCREALGMCKQEEA
ncbi:hypothetical protein FB45DRAFT_1120757 [Roridomyces roridus]|uniref:Dynamin N-terminal domain-containing protein n=1 Tax=Roridomyces roridus TaxID=1738132 RepID=A0AAD7F9P3_9AGAR|nr:hypothetical protein FB45DRAFT_1120757 [Roridomyces roridus]